MKKQKLQNFQFDGSKLKILIEQKSNDTKIKKVKIRTYMRMCMGVTVQTLSIWENMKKDRIKPGRKHGTAPRRDQLFWLKKFFNLSSTDCLFSQF